MMDYALTVTASLVRGEPFANGACRGSLLSPTETGPSFTGLKYFADRGDCFGFPLPATPECSDGHIRGQDEILREFITQPATFATVEAVSERPS
jgi:hypothetical protein